MKMSITTRREDLQNGKGLTGELARVEGLQRVESDERGSVL